MNAAPIREIALGAADVKIELRADGAILLRSPHALGDYPGKLTERLAHWARDTPARRFIAQRDAAGAWRSLTYAQTWQRVRSIGQALLERRLSQERPLAILSDNDLEHALLALACMHVGVAYVPVSSAYSLVSTDFAKLKYVMGLLTPGLVYATDGARFARAIAAAVPAGTEVLTGSEFISLEKTKDSSRVDEAQSAVGPDTIAKFLLTSGSTGQPKAVINTQRMLCSNQQMLTEAAAIRGHGAAATGLAGLRGARDPDLRRAHSLDHRRRAALRRSGRTADGIRIRWPHQRRLQAEHGDLGQCRAAARENQRRLFAAGAGRGNHRPWPESAGGAGVSERRGLPRPERRCVARAAAASTRAPGAGERRQFHACGARSGHGRAAMVERLYAEPPDPDIMVASP